MSRYLSRIGLVVAALVLAVGVSKSSAAGKRARDVKLTGMITAVSSDEKTITVASGAKGKGDAKDIKVDDKTVIEYIGIDNEAEKKLLKGYFVKAVIGESDVAGAISVQKTPFTRKQ